MPHDPLTSIGYMLNHARQARELAAGRSRNDLDTDQFFAMLLTHLMEIFGEASSRVRRIHQSALSSTGSGGFPQRPDSPIR